MGGCISGDNNPNENLELKKGDLSSRSKNSNNGIDKPISKRGAAQL